MVGIHPAYNILTLFFSSFFPAEDEAAAAHISAKNGLKSYVYNLHNSLSDEKLTDKFEPAQWLDASHEGSKEEYE